MMRTTPCAGGASNVMSANGSAIWRQCRCANPCAGVVSPVSGSVDSGSIKSAMTRTCDDTWITSTSTRSSMGTSNGWWIGPGRAFIVTCAAATCPLIGPTHLTPTHPAWAPTRSVRIAHDRTPRQLRHVSCTECTLRRRDRARCARYAGLSERFAGGGEGDAFGDVGGVVADALDVFGDEQ